MLKQILAQNLRVNPSDSDQDEQIAHPNLLHQLIEKEERYNELEDRSKRTNNTLAALTASLSKLLLPALHSTPPLHALPTPIPPEIAAPKKTGVGSIDIRIHKESDTWTQSCMTRGEPTALVGMNAGLFRYSEWM